MPYASPSGQPASLSGVLHQRPKPVEEVQAPVPVPVFNPVHRDGEDKDKDKYKHKSWRPTPLPPAWGWAPVRTVSPVNYDVSPCDTSDGRVASDMSWASESASSTTQPSAAVSDTNSAEGSHREPRTENESSGNTGAP